MGYWRLIVLVLALEVFTTAVTGLGILFGFSVVTEFSATFHSGNANTQEFGVNATLPFYMPTLSDLKIPYTLFETGTQEWGWASFLVLALFVLLQSFVRGMYLGGLKGWIEEGKAVPLIPCGRKFFRGMLAWTLFGWVLAGVAFFLAVIFIPLGVILIFAVLLFALGPYIMVLQDISFSESLAKAPRLFFRYFRTLFPLALLAMLCTFLIGLAKFLPPPWGYAVPLVIYAAVGTLLIAELMRRLAGRLREDREPGPELPFREAEIKPVSKYVTVALVPLLAGLGAVMASGWHLAAFDAGGKKELEGVSYFYKSPGLIYFADRSYTAYEWRTGDYRIRIRLPDLSGAEKPRVLRGVADIVWDVDEEVRTVSGLTTHVNVEPHLRKSRLAFRLVRETAEDGSVYYSSMNGAAAILPGQENPRKPLRAEMMVSGDGKHVFVLQYTPDQNVSQVFRVSRDGRFLIPAASSINPLDVRAYWFAAESNTQEVFALLAAKNLESHWLTLNQPEVILTAAMQEADGQAVANLLEYMRQNDIRVEAPDWDGDGWTEHLRGLYEGAGLEEILAYMSRADLKTTQLPDKSAENTSAYRMEVPFPKGTITMDYETSAENGRLVAVAVQV